MRHLIRTNGPVFFRARALARAGLLGILSAATLVLPAALCAQTNVPAGVYPANRFLLVIETSSAMQRRLEGTLRALQDLVGSAMHGQIRPHDSLGIWTFDEALHTGKLPVRQWSSEERRAITGELLGFVRGQPYEKQGRLEKVLPSMLHLVQASEFITVILVSDGSGEIHGTPFDSQINESFKLWTAQQQEAKMPFVTVLRAQRGTFTGYSVAPVPWPVDMPALPAGLQIARPTPKPPVVVAAKPPPLAPPLILHGKKPGPLTELIPAPAAASPAKLDSPLLPINQQITAEKKVAKVEPPPAVSEAQAAPGGDSSELREQRSRDPGLDPSQTTARAGAPAETGPASGALQNPPAQAAVPVATPSAIVADEGGIITGNLGVVILGAACLAGAGVVFWLWKRRALTAAHVSLITRSLDHEHR